jgi:hypothetical protein
LAEAHQRVRAVRWDENGGVDDYEAGSEDESESDAGAVDE